MTFDNTHPIEAVCPACGKPQDAASAADGADIRPRDGDISVCLYCGALGAYVEGNPMGIRILTPEERDEVIAQSSEVRQVLAVRSIIMEKARREGKIK